MFNAQDDPLGLGLAQRARERRQLFNANADEDANDAMMSANPQVTHGAVQSKFERGRSDFAAQGYNSEWEKFLESLQGVAEDQGNRLRVRGNPAMESLQPMPESYDAWSGRTKDRIYGKGQSYAGDPSMSSLKRGR